MIVSKTPWSVGVVIPAQNEETLLAYDANVVRQHQALALYIRQCHGERDLANIPPSAETS